MIPVAPERDVEILNSVKELEYPKSDFHVIVIKSKNVSKNRNVGSAKAKGEIIGFLDDDGIIESDFLKNVEGFFNKYPWVDVVGGPQLTPKDEKGFAKISGYALTSKFGAADVAGRYKKGDLKLNADEKDITSANLFVKKEVMNKIKFDENLWPGEDPKFIDDAKKEGFKVAYSPDFVIYHRRRPTIQGLMKQIFRYGKTRPSKESFVETLKKPLFLIPSIFVAYLISLIALLFINPTITGRVVGIGTKNISLKFLWFIPLIAYAFLSIFFSSLESIKNKDFRALFILLFVFPLIHISYGIGMISGWVKKIIK